MSEQTADPPFSRINQKLARLSPIPSEHSLFRVHDHLRRINVKAYEPEIIAIGPYHHGKDNLQGMEELKLRYLQQLLTRTPELSVDRCYMAMRDLKDRALKCYAEPINLSGDDLVEMMLLDGCFLIELILKYNSQNLIGVADPVFTSRQTRFGLSHDLFLFENQLPFFILVQLFNMINDPNAEVSIMSLAQSFVGGCLSSEKIISAVIQLEDVKHLLGLAHDCLCFPFSEMVSHRNVDDAGVWEFINCTTELQEAGIQLKNAEGSTSLLDIRFTNGVLEIPYLYIQDWTETLFRNLIAYEQYCPTVTFTYVTDYIIFIYRLINSSKDVELLRRCGIIIDWLGNDVAVHAMLTNLAKNASRSGYFCYSEVCRDVKLHCRRRRNVWMANLRRNYFNTPWAIISFLAAVLLLFLTSIQTVFSIFSRA